MADHIVTIENSLNLFGPAPSNKWDDWEWGSLIWGEGNAGLATSVMKYLSDSIVPVDSVAKASTRKVTNILTPIGDMGSEKLTNGSWSYNFVSGTDEGEERAFANWSEDTDEDETWSKEGSSETDWSE